MCIHAHACVSVGGGVLEVQVRYTNFSLHLWVKTSFGDYIMGFSTVLISQRVQQDGGAG